MEEVKKNTDIFNFEIEAIPETLSSAKDHKANNFRDKLKFLEYTKTGHPIKDFLVGLNDQVENLSKVKAKEKATFFRLLAVMINAGIPIVESLTVLANQTKNPRLKKNISKIADEIKKGSKLSESMKKYSGVFNESDIGMIAAGEISGRLNGVLQDIAADTEKSASLKAKIKGALTYPIVVMFILATAITLLMVMVVPQITSLFTGSGQVLPPATQMLINISDFLRNNILLVTLSPFLLVGTMSLIRKTELGKYYTDFLLLLIPVFGQLNRKAALSRFSRMISNLLKSGISIVEALIITANSIGNDVYKRRIIVSSKDIAQGIPMGENLRGNERLFPTMVVSMVAIGEQTGEISTVMDKIADFYEEEVDLMSSNFSKLLEPLILVVVGVTVGGIVAAVMQPIMSLTDMAGSM